MFDSQNTAESCSDEPALEVALQGRTLLDCSLLNKGSAFSEAERDDLGLVGLLPYHVSTLEDQVARRYEEYQQKTTALERFLFLRGLQDRNETLYYRLLQDHLVEMMPLVYTPLVGEVCQRYSHIYHRPRGLFLSYPHKDRLDTAIENRSNREVDVIVVTDGERILGLGDQGVGGIGIPVGKLALYTLCGGVHPGRTLPVVLDVGTDNAERLADPHYLGWRHPRVRGPEYDAFIEAFVGAITRRLPGVLLQWEDFSQGNARRLLDRYRDRLCTFNDDVQGTAAVTLAALLTAMRITGSRLRDQRLVLLGAGSAGTGIADLVVTAMIQEGLSAQEARLRLWLLSSRGLLHSGLVDLPPAQAAYAKPVECISGWRRDASGNVPLVEVVEKLCPTVLIGVSGQQGTFGADVVQTMSKQVERPIIFPLSNPTSHSEAEPADLIAWTEGRALVASGSPFADVIYQGRTFAVSQCNNSYVFPGLGMGLIASGARRVTDEMFLTAARTLSEFVPVQRRATGALLPPLEEIRDVSRQIALDVGKVAQDQGLASALPPDEWQRTLAARRWQPRYQPMHYRAPV